MIEKIQFPHAAPLQDIQLTNGFWAERQATNREKTIPSIYSFLESTGRLAAFDLSKDQQPPKFHKVVRMFFDSDSGKWLEAVGYSLMTHPDPALEHLADGLIDRMEKAQQPDGYLNTYFTVMETEYRWRNLRDWHEMYNAGHLIEGAVAYYQATGKRKVLDIFVRFADLIDSLFGPEDGKKRGYPGHPELELAMVKLYHATREPRYLKLAQFFIDERGQQPHYFDLESAERGEDPADFWAQSYHYCQAHAPLREQTEATGHAVRACYLYAGLVDVALETGDPSLLETARRLWDDLIGHQMYINGGLGPAQSNEGFTFAYDLPNETAYAETCAAIALVLYAQRMFHLDPDARYIDVMERALYNGILSGVSYDGTHFFYANPLAAYPKVSPDDPWSAIKTDPHYRRQEWFYCPCCPPNVARLVASIGAYFYGISGDTVYVNLYDRNRARIDIHGKMAEFEQKTSYPWDGDIEIEILSGEPVEYELALRIPGWCRQFDVRVNGDPISAEPQRGYVRIRRRWIGGDRVRLSLAMPVERMAPHPMIRQDAGCVALQRGPVLYCIEGTDNGEQLANVILPPDSQLSVVYDASLFGGIPVITADALRVGPSNWANGLYQPQAVLDYARTSTALRAIPYSLWANRAPGEMRVWIRES
ncbi:MAG: glycoside hydrolase family 127 protein [Anaerolineae bacterium]|nr:glycoside hydrolase family 127 protein [Anaerolineae bacterium]